MRCADLFGVVRSELGRLLGRFAATEAGYAPSMSNDPFRLPDPEPDTSPAPSTPDGPSAPPNIPIITDVPEQLPDQDQPTPG